MSGGTWTEYATARLADAGRRSGGARSAVVELLGRQGCALSAFEIEAQLRRSRRSVGRASVYRALEELERLGLVARVEVGDGLARFEPVDPEGHHHHHFVCAECGTIVPFHDDGLERAITRLARRLKLEVGAHEVTLRGACSRCVRTGS